MNNMLQKWVLQFADSVIGQNESIEKHDTQTGNNYAKKYIEASEALMSAGSEGISAFANLLRDERVAVRVMAASYLLPYRTNEAVLVLEEAAKGNGITSFGAFMALKRWQST